MAPKILSSHNFYMWEDDVVYNPPDVVDIANPVNVINNLPELADILGVPVNFTPNLDLYKFFDDLDNFFGVADVSEDEEVSDDEDVPEVEDNPPNIYDDQLRTMTQRQDITINQLNVMTKNERNEIWQEIQQYLLDKPDIRFNIDRFERYIIANYEPEVEDEDMFFGFNGATIVEALEESVSPEFRRTDEFHEIAFAIIRENKFISTIINASFRNQHNVEICDE